MFDQALRFLFDVVFGLFTYAFLLRFLMQWQRAPFRNPVSQAVVALTDWAVKPVRRIVPGFRGVDWSTLLLAYVAQLVWLVATTLVIAGGPWTGNAIAFVAVFAIVELVKTALWLLIWVVIAQAVLSWVAPDGPFAGLLNALTFRFLAPIRRVVPPVGGTLDLSPLILIVILQLIVMLPIAWLERAIAAAMR
jgi:YggT family protein